MFVPQSINSIKVYEQKNAINKNYLLGSYFIDKAKFVELKSFTVIPLDIIVSCAGTIGETYVLPEEAPMGIINQALMRIRLFNKDIIDFYLLYFDYVLKKEAQEQSAGSAMKNIPPFSILKKMLIPLPPINEQQRILKQYNILYSKIISIQKNQEDIKQFLSFLKYKILDSIFSENSRYKSYYNNREKTSLEKLIPKDKIGDGDWVLSSDMNPNGDINLLQLKHIGYMQCLNKPYAKVDEKFFIDNKCKEIKKGYLLINRLIADKMNCCILENLERKTITSVDVCWIAPDNSYNLEYLLYYLSSKIIQDQVQLLCSGSTRKRISKKNLIKIDLLIHPIEYQNQIVKDIKTLFNQIDNMIL